MSYSNSIRDDVTFWIFFATYPYIFCILLVLDSLILESLQGLFFVLYRFGPAILKGKGEWSELFLCCSIPPQVSFLGPVPSA